MAVAPNINGVLCTASGDLHDQGQSFCAAGDVAAEATSSASTAPQNTVHAMR